MSLVAHGVVGAVFGPQPVEHPVPQALAGVATVALVWDTVRRRFATWPL